MKAIILAAGEGKRMRPLTLVEPKPMVRVLGIPLLAWIIEGLPDEITELVLVIGYKGDEIKKYFGKEFKGKPITYITQAKATGTAHALLLCRDLLEKDERFLFMYADDLHSSEAIKKLLKKPIGLLVKEHTDPTRFGVIEADAKGRVTSLIEKPKHPKSNLVSIGVFVLDTRVFDYVAPRHESGEYFLADQVGAMLKDHEMIIEKSDFWHPISNPSDIRTAEGVLRKKYKLSKELLNTTPVIILAGGKGTRMPESEKNKPKALVEIAGKPMLHWQIEELKKQRFSNIILSLGYEAEMVIDWLKQSGNSHIKYVIEKEPLGTGGGLKLATEGINEPFLALNADDIADIDFKALIEHGGKGSYNVLAGVKINDASAFGLLECDEYKKICSFKEKKADGKGGLVNIGHYYLLPEIFKGTPKMFSLEHDLFPELAKKGKLVIYEHTGFWFPTGTAEQLQASREYFAKK